MDLDLLVLPDGVDEKSKGGIWAPQTAIEQKKREQMLATIIEAGESAGEKWSKNEQSIIRRPGTRVIIGKYVGAEISKDWTRDGRDYLLINDEDVMGVIED